MAAPRGTVRARYAVSGDADRSAQAPVIVCADDFAIAPGVSAGILELLSHRRLSATSCMTASPLWPRLAPGLSALAQQADIGLHLILTDARPLGAMPRLAPDGRLPPVRRLMALAFAGRIDRAEVAGELRRQLDAFVSATGAPPDFIDGHQHVHLLAGIREEVLALFEGPLARHGTYLRICWEPVARILARRVAVGRALIIAAMSRGLGREARRRGIPTNDSFRGVVDFKGADFPRQFRRFLDGGGERPIIMCHPGIVDAELAAADPVTEHREREFDYFAGEVFPRDLEAAGCRLARFREIRGAVPSREVTIP